jgi:hypothetical protein
VYHGGHKKVCFDIIIIIIIIILYYYYYYYYYYCVGTTALRPITENIYIYVCKNTQITKMKRNIEKRCNKKVSVNQFSLYYNC